jgi:uncharacterized protein
MFIPANGRINSARFADQYRLGLGAGDAVHLAISADRGTTLCSLDRNLAKAGSRPGVKTARFEPPS